MLLYTHAQTDTYFFFCILQVSIFKYHTINIRFGLQIFHLLTAGQSIVPAHKVFSRVDTSQIFSGNAHFPVIFCPITLPEHSRRKHLCGCSHQFFSIKITCCVPFLPVQLRGRPAAALQHSHPSLRWYCHRSYSENVWLFGWMCWWHSSRNKRSNLFKENDSRKF